MKKYNKRTVVLILLALLLPAAACSTGNDGDESELMQEEIDAILEYDANGGDWETGELVDPNAPTTTVIQIDPDADAQTISLPCVDYMIVRHASWTEVLFFGDPAWVGAEGFFIEVVGRDGQTLIESGRSNSDFILESPGVWPDDTEATVWSGYVIDEIEALPMGCLTSFVSTTPPPVETHPVYEDSAALDDIEVGRMLQAHVLGSPCSFVSDGTNSLENNYIEGTVSSGLYEVIFSDAVSIWHFDLMLADGSICQVPTSEVGLSSLFGSWADAYVEVIG